MDLVVGFWTGVFSSRDVQSLGRWLVAGVLPMIVNCCCCISTRHLLLDLLYCHKDMFDLSLFPNSFEATVVVGLQRVAGSQQLCDSAAGDVWHPRWRLQCGSFRCRSIIDFSCAALLC